MFIKYIVFLCLFVCSNQVFSTSKPLLINSPDWRPYFFYNDTTSGYAKELLAYLLEDNGYAFDFVPLPIQRGNQYAKSGKIDLAVFSYNEGRESFLHYSSLPLFTISLRFISRKEHSEIKDLSMIRNLRFEFVRGVSYTKELREEANVLEKDFYTSVTLEHALKKILAKRSDITAASIYTLNTELKSINHMNQLRISSYQIDKKHYYLTVSKKSKIPDSKEFLRKMDLSLKKAINNGIVDSLSKKYNLILE